MRYRLEEFAALDNITNLTFSPNGEQVAYIANTSGQFNLWKRNVKQPSTGQPNGAIQLTGLVDERVLKARWSPNGHFLIGSIDFHGYELFQLCEVPVEGGDLRPLTQSFEVRHELANHPFGPDGRSIAYAANARNPGEFDVVVRDLTNGETRTILKGGGNYIPDSWSPDGRYILAFTWNVMDDSDLFLCDMVTGESQCLTTHTGKARISPGAWSHDGNGFYFLTDQDREFLGLFFYDLKTKETTTIATPTWDVQEMDVSRDGNYLVWVVNEGGFSRLYIRDLQTNQTRPAELPQGVIRTIRFGPTAPVLGLYLSRAVHPTELYMLDVERGDCWQLTESFKGRVQEREMVEPELIHYPSFDGRMIPAFLYRPRDSAGPSFPFVISVHGGPEAQELPIYVATNGFYQYLLHCGIGVLAPNFRGSTGYGKNYQSLVRRDWGGDELKDLEYAALYLKGQNWVDNHRLGFFGGSYGGFAVLSLISRFPQYAWAAAVDMSGPSNLVSYTASFPPFAQQYARETIGHPEADAEFLRERSPLTYTENIRTPLLVFQGANDTRVPKAESDQIVERLKSLEREVEYVIFDDEGHMFSKTENWQKALKLSAEWFEKHLLH